MCACCGENSYQSFPEHIATSLEKGYSGPPNILSAPSKTQMDEYSALANKTRNLEQEYISQAFIAHAEQVAALQKSIAECEERRYRMEDGEDLFEDLRPQLRKLEEENKKNKDEIKRMKNEHTEKIERLKAHGDTASEAENRIRLLEEENDRLRMQSGNDGGGKKKNAGKKYSAVEDWKEKKFPGIETISRLSDKQDQILRDIRELVGLREDYKSRIGSLEAEIDVHKANEERFREETYKLRSAGGNEDAAALRQRIVALERENNQHVREAYAHEKNEKLVKEQKDTIVLLQDSISNKERAIEMLTAQVERLKKTGGRGADEEPADMIKPQRSVVNVEDLAGPAPHAGTVAPGKGAKKAAPSKQKKIPSKLVSVEKLIKDDNSQFFNNLSFTNSSPMPDKKNKRN